MTDPGLQEEIRRLEAQFEAHPGSLLFARLADLVRKAGDPERALEILRAGLESHPDYLSAHIVRARALEDLERPGEAERAYRDVLELDDQNLVALDALARAAEARGDDAEAATWYERLLSVDPHNQGAAERLEVLRATEPAAGEEPPKAGGAPDAGPEGDTAEPPEPADQDEGPHDAFGLESPDPEEIRTSGWPWKQEYEEDAGDEGAASGETSTGDESRAWEEEPRWAEAAAGGGEAEHAAGFETDEGPDEGPDAGPEPGAEAAEDVQEPGAFAGEPEPEAFAEEPEREVEAESAPDVDEEPEPDADLPTETLAGLYEAQGLYEEAVAIYEKLARRRPHDAALQERLRAAREELEGGPGTEEAAPPVGEPEEEPGAGWEVEEAPGAGTATAAREPGWPGSGGGATTKPTMREHLLALLRGEARPDEPVEPDR